MAWNGYFVFDDTEIINATRTEKYASIVPSFKPLYENEDIEAMLNVTPYFDPVTDPAPWYDADVPESGDFWGFYPLDVTGIENSSRSSMVQENTMEGGTPGRIRHGVKSVVFNGLLLGKNDEAVAFGMTWLRRALLGKACSKSLTSLQALGAPLEYLSATPVSDDNLMTDPPASLVRYQRALRRFAINSGPSVTFQGDLSCGATVWTVQFTGIAGLPWEFGAERAILQDYLEAGDPWVPGVTEGTITGPATYTDVECGENIWQPVFDPECPALIVPPPPASIPLACFEMPASWSRRSIVLQPDLIPLWGEVMPKITLYSAAGMRGARIRFYDNPDGNTSPNDNPCEFNGDIVISYIPPGGTMIIDAASREVNVITNEGHRRRADSLVFASDGTPTKWPTLTCGYGYILTYDVVAGEPAPILDLSLIPRAV